MATYSPGTTFTITNFNYNEFSRTTATLYTCPAGKYAELYLFYFNSNDNDDVIQLRRTSDSIVLATITDDKNNSAVATGAGGSGGGGPGGSGPYWRLCEGLEVRYVADGGADAVDLSMMIIEYSASA